MGKLLKETSQDHKRFGSSSSFQSIAARSSDAFTELFVKSDEHKQVLTLFCKWWKWCTSVSSQICLWKVSPILSVFLWLQMQWVPFATIEMKGSLLSCCRNPNSSSVLNKKDSMLPCCLVLQINPHSNDNCLTKVEAAILVLDFFHVPIMAASVLFLFLPSSKFLQNKISPCLLLPPDTFKYFCIYAH